MFLACSIVLIFSTIASVLPLPNNSWMQIACERTNHQLAFCNRTETIATAIDVFDKREEPSINIDKVVVSEKLNDDEKLKALLDEADSLPPPTPDPEVVKAEKLAKLESDSVCTNFSDRYYHYCVNISAHPVDLQPKLRLACPKYEELCSTFITTISPLSLLPDVPVVSTVKEPCTYNCQKPYCTRECKCAYYKDQMKENCKPGNQLPLFQQNCQIWFKSCKDLYHIPPEYLTGRSITNETNGASSSNGNTRPSPHTGFWNQGTDLDTDWANGKVKTGTPIGVPAVGFGANLNQNEFQFPGPLSFLGRK